MGNELRLDSKGGDSTNQEVPQKSSQEIQGGESIVGRTADTAHWIQG